MVARRPLHRILFHPTYRSDFDKKKDDEQKSDVRVITRAVYRLNGAGYLEPDRPSHIWTVEVPKTTGEPQKAKQITTGEFSESDIVWSRDGSQIYFISRRVSASHTTKRRTPICMW